MMIGKTILHYKIHEKLGEGGMGEVYLAEDTRLKRHVAIKWLPEQLSLNVEDRQRLHTEAQAAAALNHPNLATIFAIEEIEERPFIVMEYIEGEELSDHFEKGQLSSDAVIPIALQIAEGLQAAHQKGVVHRDIKSANIMINNAGQVKIMDFGLATFADQSGLKERGLISGTAAYMSPEQANGETVDHRSDIWSLGVVLFELLTGELPFQGDYAQALFYAILSEAPQKLDEMGVDAPEILQSVLDKALAKDREQRYQQLTELIADLKQVADWAPLVEDTPPSLAVLPFKNISAQKEQEYFCDGMTEELIDALSRVENWRVVSRTSVFALKEQLGDVREIGERLNVSHLIEGSVRQVGNRVRVSAQLINVADGFHLWSEKYDRELDDIFAIQDDIAQAIVEKLKMKLSSGESASLFKRYTDNKEAYQLYLKGRYFLNRGTSVDSQKSIEYFEEALEKDINYTLAYSGLADAYILLGGTFSAPLSPQEAMPKAKAAAKKAMAIDDQLAEAHTSLAFVRFWYDWDWAGAEKEFLRAIELKPAYTRAYQWYAEYLSAMKQFDAAREMILKALDIDPLSVHITWHVGKIAFLAGRHDEAIEYCNKAVDMDPGFLPAHGILRRVYEQKRMFPETLKAAGWLSGKKSESPAALEAAYQQSGWEGVWQSQLELFKKKNSPPLRYAELYALLNDKDQAFHWLEEAFQQRSSSLVYLNVYASFDNLRADARFDKLLRKIGLNID